MMETTEAVVTGGTLNTVCSRDELLHALGIVSRGVSTRTTVQILSGILLEAEEGTLRLAAPDMEVSLRPPGCYWPFRSWPQASSPTAPDTRTSRTRTTWTCSRS